MPQTAATTYTLSSRTHRIGWAVTGARTTIQTHAIPAPLQPQVEGSHSKVKDHIHSLLNEQKIPANRRITWFVQGAPIISIGTGQDRVTHPEEIHARMMELDRSSVSIEYEGARVRSDALGTPRTERTSMTLDTEVLESLNAYVEGKPITRSAYVNALLREALNLPQVAPRYTANHTQN